jgi:hypothetical protein
MPIQVVGAVAGAAARGAVAGTRVVGRGAVQATAATTRVARQGVEKTSSAVTSTSSSTVRRVSDGVRVANQTVEKSEQAGYRAGRFVSRAVREESKKKQDDALGVRYGTPTRAQRTIGRGGRMTPSSFMGQRNTVKQAHALTNQQRGAKMQRISKNEGRVMIAVAVLFDLLPLLLIITPFVALLGMVGDKAAGIVAGLGGVAAIVAIITFSPMIYTFGSLLSVVLGVLLFGVWFMFKGVSPISLGFYMLFEAVPVINILPMFTAGVWRCIKGATREDEQRRNFSNRPVTT